MASQAPYSDAEQLKPVNQAWRRTLAARIVATGFILTIVMGNFWLIEAVFGQKGSSWITGGFAVGVVAVFLGGAILLLRLFMSMLP